MRDLDLVNARKLIFDEIPDICSRSQLLKPSELIRIAFKLDKNVYFIYIHFKIIKDRFPGAYHPLNRYNILLKHLVQGPPIQ